MNLRSKRQLTFGTAIVCATLLAACGSPNSTDQGGGDGKPHQGGSVTLAVTGGSDLGNLNTQMTSDTGPLVVADLWADGLFSYDGRGDRVNHLATGVDLSKDRRTYTISLRKHVKFSDGTPFSSADVAFNLDVLAKYNTYLTAILPKIDTVATPDDSTVVVTLKEPFAPFLDALDKEVFPILPKHVYEKGDPATNPANQEPVGLGPYKFDSQEGGQLMTFVRNANYWQAPKPYLDQVFVKSVPDPEQQVNALLSDEVGWTKLSYSNVKRVQEAGNKAVTAKSAETPAPETLVLDLNTAEGGPLADPDVRKALYVGIDRSRVIDDAYDGFASEPQSAIPTAFHDLYNPDVDYTSEYAFDAKKAGKMLDEAGYPMKDGHRFSIKLSYITGDSEYPFDAAARILAAEWKDIGVDLTLDGLDAQVWTDQVYTKQDFDVSMISLTGRTDPVLGVDRSFLCNDDRLPFVNPTGYCDPKFDAVALKAQQAAAGDRQAIYGEYEQMISDALPQLPLAQADAYEGVSTKFGGLDKQFDMAYNEHSNWADVWTK
ncbi:ABC transporter substrate-binding protein [Nocardioides insulae]|uniref:ABC transporter substrate-binding protein n=1 Tax=Nocardioides insulae TaxID=394734 RepID=UPI00146EBF3D|nr:ABC transporter substrate-binding protein [Nocardioides insulae]